MKDAKGKYIFAAKNPLLAMIFSFDRNVEGEIHFLYDIESGVPAILYVGYDPSQSLLKSGSVLHLNSTFFRPVGESGEYISDKESVPIEGHLKVDKLSAMGAGVQIFYMDPKEVAKYEGEAPKQEGQNEKGWYKETFGKWRGQLERDANGDPHLDSEFRAMELNNEFQRNFLNEFVNKGVLIHLNSQCLLAGKKVCVLDLETGELKNKPIYHYSWLQEEIHGEEINHSFEPGIKSAL